jgi:hypothetical protein
MSPSLRNVRSYFNFLDLPLSLWHMALHYLSNYCWYMPCYYWLHLMSQRALDQEPQLQLATVGLYVEPQVGSGERCMQPKTSKVGALACLSSCLLLSLLSPLSFGSVSSH